MGGCDWQNKSFSVAVYDEKINYICQECKTPTDGKLKLNGDILCEDCWHKKPGKGLKTDDVFFTHRDLRYQFTADIFGEGPVEIRSKGHFETLLKQHGLVHISHKECKQEAAIKQKTREQDRKHNNRKVAENIFMRKKELIRRVYG